MFWTKVIHKFNLYFKLVFHAHFDEDYKKRKVGRKMFVEKLCTVNGIIGFRIYTGIRLVLTNNNNQKTVHFEVFIQQMAGGRPFSCLP